MIYCTKCGMPHEERPDMLFCQRCGTQFAQAPNVTTYNETVYSAPKRDVGAKVMSIIGMSLGIYGDIGVFGTFIYALCSIIYMYVNGMFALYGVLFAIISIVFAILYGGANIAAIILGRRAEANGELTKITKASKITGLVGVILHGAGLVLAIILVCINSSTFYSTFYYYW